MTDTEEAQITTTARRYRERLARSGPVFVGAIGTVLLFVSAIQLLGAATDAARPFLVEVLGRVVVGDVSALGLSWLVTYGLTNGSVAAAIALSLFNAELISSMALFLMIVGSRLGGAAIVVLIGALDYLQHRGDEVERSVGLGTYSFLVTHSIYLPLAVVGAVSLPAVFLLESVATGTVVLSRIGGVGVLDGPVDRVAGLLGALPTVAVAMNGPRKGIQPRTFQDLTALPSLEALYQIHFNTQHDGRYNTAPGFIASPKDAPDTGEFIKASVDLEKGVFTIRIGATETDRTYSIRQ